MDNSPIMRPRPAPAPSNIAAPPTQTQAITPMINGVPLEMMDFFGVDISKMDSTISKQLSEIYAILRPESADMGDVMLKVSEIARKLGAPSYHETRYGKVWQYLKVQSRISDLEKQKRAMEVVHDEFSSSVPKPSASVA